MVTSAVFLSSFIVNNHSVDIYGEFLHGRRLMKDSRIFCEQICEQNSISSTIELFRGRRTIPCLIFRFPQQLINYFWTVQVCML